MSMGETTQYFVVRKKAVPEVLLKVVEAKRLLESEKVMTIQDAVDAVGISRSSCPDFLFTILLFVSITSTTPLPTTPYPNTAMFTILSSILPYSLFRHLYSLANIFT